MSLITEEIRAKATIYPGKEACEEKVQLLLEEVGLPNGLLPLGDAEECGYIPETGFVWLKQKEKIEHKFEMIDRLVTYASEITAYIEPCKITKLTGVKARELLIWLTINEISVPTPKAEKITFKAVVGPTRTFPTEAFMLKEPPISVENAKNKEENKELKIKFMEASSRLAAATEAKEV